MVQNIGIFNIVIIIKYDDVSNLTHRDILKIFGSLEGHLGEGLFSPILKFIFFRFC